MKVMMTIMTESQDCNYFTMNMIYTNTNLGFSSNVGSGAGPYCWQYSWLWAGTRDDNEQINNTTRERREDIICCLSSSGSHTSSAGLDIGLQWYQWCLYLCLCVATSCVLNDNYCYKGLLISASFSLFHEANNVKP